MSYLQYPQSLHLREPELQVCVHRLSEIWFLLTMRKSSMACTHTWPWSFLMVLLICSGLRLFRDLMRPKLLELSVSGLRKTIVFQKELLEIKRFFTDPYMDYYRFHGITPYPCGPRTPCQIEQKLLSGCSNVHGPLWPKHLLMKAMVSVLLFDKL